MPQDAFTLKFIARELSSSLVGGKISRINQPAKDVLIFLIYTKNETVKLTCDLSAKYCRLSLGEKTDWVNPDAAPAFLMLLRKHLQNAEILNVAAVDGERIVKFDFNCFSEFATTKLTLYFEIMGKYSNAILTRDDVILGAMKTASLETGARRVTLSGAKYVLPFKQDKAPQSDLNAIRTALDGAEEERARAIADRVAGVAYSTALHITEIYGENASAEQVYNYLNSDETVPCVTYSDGEPTDFNARYREGAKKTANILAAQREYYDYAVQKKNFSDYKRKLENAVHGAIKKAEKRLSDISDKLQECVKMDDMKLYGELITANIYAVERGADKLEATNYYNPDMPTIAINLDKRLTPAQNAQRYYKKYAKLKRANDILTRQKSEAEEKLAYLHTIESNVKRAECVNDLVDTERELIELALLPPPRQPQKKKKAEPAAANNYRRYVFDGFTVLCGRNNLQNESLTKSLKQNDLWVHAKAYHSAHVAILCDGKPPTDEAIKRAAEVCAYYSDARENGKVPVDYTFKKFVKKPKGGAAGYFDYTDYKTILVAPDGHTEERTNE